VPPNTQKKGFFSPIEKEEEKTRQVNDYLLD
jgi:hypothetical protein